MYCTYSQIRVVCCPRIVQQRAQGASSDQLLVGRLCSEIHCCVHGGLQQVNIHAGAQQVAQNLRRPQD